MVPYTLLNIAQTGIQIDIFHTFHDIRINKGAVFPKPCDKLLHLLALGSMDNITASPAAARSFAICSVNRQAHWRK